MKAAIYTAYGPPEVVKVLEVPSPTIGSKDVLIKVHAATVNRTDAGFRSAEYFISRFWSGLFKPKKQILGCEFSGVVHEIGNEVTAFKVGDKVFGFNDKSFGAHAEFVAMPENSAIAIMPTSLDFKVAAALTEGSHYALVDIKAANVQPGQHVMVYGATGSIGSAAVQLLKYYGAIVTAVCNTKNVEVIKSIGADVIIDYQTQDYTKTNTKFQFIFDAIGKSSFAKCKPILTSNGIYISTEFGKNGVNILLALTTPIMGGKKLLFPLPTITKEDVNFLKELAQTGKFLPLIDKEYKLEQIVEAYRYVDSGQKTGNVVISFAN